MKAAMAAVCMAVLAAAQQFEIASVKPAGATENPGRMGGRINTSPGLLTTRNASLKDLIAAAYGLESYQVSGGPGWIDSARFVVEAKPAAAANREQLLFMLRSLLADRFKLAFHSEKKEVPVYGLVIGKNGPKLKPASDSARGTLNRLGRNVDLPWLARYLSHYGSDRPVIDKTGLTGNFDLGLDMEKISAAAGEQPSIGNMFQATVEAMQEQLGLKLTPMKVPIEVLVVDHAERPGAN